MTLVAEMGVIRGGGDVDPIEQKIVALEMWKVAHDARINEKWEAQEKLNGKIETKMGKFEARLRAVETRVLLLAFAGGTAGAGLGQVILERFYGG